MKAVFFDAEGTLYVAREGRTYTDFWDRGEPTLARAIEHFELNEGVIEILEKLGANDLMMAVVSKHREELLPELLEHLGIYDYFEEVLMNDDKGHLMVNFLRERDIPKEEAVMVGDTYEMDIQPARREGITGLLLGGPELERISDLVHYVE